ncbi:diguanylate cyclase [Deinococcus taeanensis]|uniref:HD domain-containing phosphohydrolase n=1 Tax=Deinococcus taeanensis TaxID=2737050 RepID=UPI001CDB9EDF|nr:HD domain-containing phosphohydrolase [Deinococcus taeanensis]UBV42300.1 diguanylate cyclase [Deinococcus taeanensis]
MSGSAASGPADPGRGQTLRRALGGRLTGGPRAMYLLLTLTALCTVGSSAVINDASRHQRIVLLLADTTAATRAVSALEWQALSADRPPPAVQVELRAGVQQLHELRRALTQVSGAPLPGHEAPQGLTSVLPLLDRYANVMTRQSALLDAAGPHTARTVSRVTVAPAVGALLTRIGEVRALQERAARRSLQAAVLLALLTALTALLTAALLTYRLQLSLQQARTLRAEAQQQLEREERDPLTGLWNRRGLARQFMLAQAAGPLSVAVLDLNRLKSINDLGGHGAGDAHLRRMAHALQAACEDRGTAARLGGDEFALLLPRHTPDQAQALLRSVASSLEHPEDTLPPFAHGAVQVTAVTSLDRVLTLADAAMYEHKEQQRLEASSGRSLGASVEEFTSRLEQLETPQGVLLEGLRIAREVLGFDGSAYLERRGETFVLSRLDGRVPEGTAAVTLGRVYRGGRGLTGQVIERSVTCWSNDYPAETHVMDIWVEAGLKSVLMVPVRYGGRLMGVISLLHFETWRVITPQARRLTEALASRLGHTFEQQVAVENVRHALQGGLMALGAALEERDLETAGHTERVVQLAERLGRRMGLTESALDALRHGASLHDIGKLTIPDAILLKPGPLNAPEWQVMQHHAARGYDIAQRLQGLMPGTLDVIRHHHERWDGAGYPDRLAGECIPLVARIFAVCDVYDALTHPRPYKPAWTHAEAVTEIRALGGTHFDPHVTQAFLRLMDQRAPQLSARR